MDSLREEFPLTPILPPLCEAVSSKRDELQGFYEHLGDTCFARLSLSD